MNFFLIDTPDTVYATYGQTICFKQAFSNYSEREAALTGAKSAAFAYATMSPRAHCEIVVFDKPHNDEAIFAYLQKRAK